MVWHFLTAAPPAGVVPAASTVLLVRTASVLSGDGAARLRALPWSYPDPGVTRDEGAAARWNVRRRADLGVGKQVWDNAVDGLWHWQIQLGAGIGVAASAPAVAVGEVVVLRLGPPGVGLRAPCRVVWVLDEPRRQGFGYGTLPGHPESGEEAFVLTLGQHDTVSLTITASSRPATVAARLGGPITRAVQHAVISRYLKALKYPPPN